MMRIIRRIWEDIRTGQNLDVYLAVFVAFLVTILGTFGVANEQVIFSAILSTLALISISLLITRQESRNIRLSLDNTNKPDDLAERFLHRRFDRSILSKHIRHTRRAMLWGFSFTSTIPYLRDEIDRGLQDGLEIRFLLVEPYSTAASLAMFGRSDEDANEFNNALSTNLAQLMRHAGRASRGKIEIRVVNYPPPYSLIAFDPHLQTGHIFVRLLDFNIPREQSPWFELTREDNPRWFEFYANQFELVWNRAQEYPLAKEIR